MRLAVPCPVTCRCCSLGVRTRLPSARFRTEVRFDVTSVTITPSQFTVPNPIVIVQRRNENRDIVDAHPEFYDELQPGYKPPEEREREQKRRINNPADELFQLASEFDVPPSDSDNEGAGMAQPNGGEG